MADRKILFHHVDLTVAQDGDGNVFVRNSDRALVVPITPQKEVILISEVSPAFGETALLVPGGIVDGDEPPYMTAQRKLQEDLGYAAGRLDALGALHMDATHSTRKVYVYLARDLMPNRRRDEASGVRLGRLPLANFERLIASGRLSDASSIAALFMAVSYLKQGRTATQRR
jgi:8-oxo-dGTP pyrophosphatase MutT (NUDIX family)